ncbi:MAG: phenylalanine--tRNA ligase subunit alpha [Candidatus Omnitrophica bacterium]|nr:phenylalanine--tRNA ligase subunit alpha [Candidatus Omnitrophota bacterium]
MEEEILKIKKEAVQQITAATAAELESLHIKFLGRKSLLAQLTARLRELPPAQKPLIGRLINETKRTIEQMLEEKSGALAKAEGEEFDLTLPALPQACGSLHPLTLVAEEIEEVFKNLGFVVAEGDEIEDEDHNFSALNIPLEHPSRDMFDTFYLEEGLHKKETQGRLLLRSHTSPAQIRVMRNLRPPLAVLVPGRVYRPDAVDATHSFMFHQIEGFAVDRDLRFSDLKGVLINFARKLFTAETQLRFRPSFFPFTEPSAEVDISCIICKGKGCTVCKGNGWLEVLGCGMIHPRVLQACGIDSKKWQGYAFGMGVERIAMLKFGIDDIRLFYNNHKKFLEQFNAF